MFANVYQHFIRVYLCIISLPIALLKKIPKILTWNQTSKEEFSCLKQGFNVAFFLEHPNPLKVFVAKPQRYVYIRCKFSPVTVVWLKGAAFLFTIYTDLKEYLKTANCLNPSRPARIYYLPYSSSHYAADQALRTQMLMNRFYPHNSPSTVKITYFLSPISLKHSTGGFTGASEIVLWIGHLFL